MQHNKAYYNTLQCTAMHYNTLQYTAMYANTKYGIAHLRRPQQLRCNTLQHTLQHTPTHAPKRILPSSAPAPTAVQLQHTATRTSIHTATHCNTVQRTAAHSNTHCNTLQHTIAPLNAVEHTAIRCNTLRHRPKRQISPSRAALLSRTAGVCGEGAGSSDDASGVLQGVAGCCRVLQCYSVW